MSTSLALLPVVGQHLLVELYDCNPTLLDDHAYIVETLRGAAVDSGATVLDMTSHQFIPQGVTAIALLAESHMSIHTWPEHSYAAIDIFTCGDAMQPGSAVTALKVAFQSQNASVRQLSRGMKNE